MLRMNPETECYYKPIVRTTLKMIRILLNAAGIALRVPMEAMVGNAT